MVSDGETFEIFIPSQNKFITGSASIERPSAKPIENLRPQHLINAVFLSPIPPDAPVLFEQEREGNSQFYVLTVVRAANAASPQDWEIASRIRFDRADLSIARIETYDSGGNSSRMCDTADGIILAAYDTRARFPWNGRERLPS